MRALAILFLVPGFSLGLVAGATHLVGPLDPVPAQPTSLEWSNRIFPTKVDFETWLVARGSSYELWSQRHPVAAHHFDDASRSLASNSATKHSTVHVQSGVALAIAIISFAVLLAMLILTRYVRSARFLWDPPTGLRVRRSSPRVAAAYGTRSGGRARAPRRLHLPDRPKAALLMEGALPARQKARGTLGRLGRIAPGRASLLAARSNSRLVRHYLPRVTFYAAAVVLSFAIGAWIAIYLQ
ncbi:MAG TPA: hypothetical protein VIM33_13210 [Gaiellaceae bacterium]|jgi:hypothetical protein